MTMEAFNPFQGEQHRPFHWQGSASAALLVHGFPGTPAEMRNVGEVLHQAGWTVQGLLLPGFGAEMRRMLEYGPDAWINATAQKIRELRKDHDEVVLVGYSMGGAVAINAARQQAPDQLVLISPFWQLGGAWSNRLWPLLRLVFRSFKPFQRADFADPKVRKGISNFMPDVDLDDPTVQAELRQMTIPSALLDGLRTVGKMAFDNAKDLDIPGMVVQGRNDEVVGMENTRRLVERLGNSFQYHEVDADHLLIDKNNAGFPHLQEQILNYLNRTAATASVSTNGAGFNKDK